MSDTNKQKNIEGWVFLVLFCLTIPLANWMIGHVGTVCLPNGPCLLPVAPHLLAPAALVIASAAAFLLSEFADFAVYTPLARRRLVLAVLASSSVGLVVDSIVFLWLGFTALYFVRASCRERV